MEIHQQSGNKDEDAPPQDAFAEYYWRHKLYIDFMKAVHEMNFTYQPASPNDPLSQDRPFLVSHLTALKAYDTHGSVLSSYKVPTDYSGDQNKTGGFLPPSGTAKVEARYGHIGVTYDPGTQKKPPSFVASQAHLDYNSQDFDMAYKALQERAKIALILAYSAKAAGWKSVDFGDTSDPVDRLMLTYACDHVGLKYKEDVMNSPHVHVSPFPQTNKVANDSKWDMEETILTMFHEYIANPYISFPATEENISFEQKNMRRKPTQDELNAEFG